jgi:broad specificity phosphatase PhoE
MTEGEVMTTFYFLRRGKVRASEAMQPDPGLSEAGRQQALTTARFLAEDRIACVYASPLRRAVQTAEIVATHCGGDAGSIPVKIAPALRERVNWGDIPNQSYDEFQAMWERCNRERKFVPPNGNSSLDAGQRLEDFCLAVLREPHKDAVVAVTHGGILADFLLNVCSRKELERLNPAFADAPYDGSIMVEGSITTVRFDGYSLKIVEVARTDHLHAYHD